MDEPGPRILVVEAVSGGALLTGIAADLGMRVVVASADTADRTVPPHLRGRIDELITVETNDLDALTERVAELHRRRPIDAVFPGCDVYVPTAAHIASRLGLVGLDVRTVDRVRDKARMREAVAAAGLETPRFAEVRARGELQAAAASVGFPCVLKPADQSGSLHVTRADTLGELVAAYDAMASDTLLGLGRPMGSRAVVEEYLAGPEVSVEGYVLDGKTTVVAVTEKILGPEPHFAELGHVVPAAVPEQLHARIESYVAAVTEAVGLSVGPFHCEVRLTRRGPVLVEIGARMGGDYITQLVELACGVSLARVWLAAHLRVSPESLDAFAPPAAPLAAITFFTAPGRGVFEGAAGLDEVRALPGVREVQLDAQPGDPVYDLVDFRCRLGHALMTADSREALTRLRERIVRTVVVNPDATEPKGAARV